MDGRMRPGQPGKRNRGRGGRRIFNPRTQVFDSNGPSVRIRGNALQIYEKYQQLARDSSVAGDRVAAENLMQHAEHYFRIYSQTNGLDRRPRPPGEERPDGDGRMPPDEQGGGMGDAAPGGLSELDDAEAPPQDEMA